MGSNELLGVLFACPLCGGREGYKLAEGDSFRWWVVNCAACGERVTECRSDMRTSAGEQLPAEWPPAAKCWNEAGAYAEGMRAALDNYRQLVREIDVALNGEEGAAEQASLCDIAGQVCAEARKRGRPLLAPNNNSTTSPSHIS